MDREVIIRIAEKYYPDEEDIGKKAKLLAIICDIQESEAFEALEALEAFEALKPFQELKPQDKPKEAIAPVTEINPADILSSLKMRQLSGLQRSQGWLNERTNYITASVSAACAGLMGPEARESQILNKASNGKYQSFKGGYYTDMGNIFEDVTAEHYSKLNSRKIHDFHLIPHNSQEYSFLGASTDGVTDNLINIEIKTLAGRELDAKIKKEYGHQMQHQMECLNLKKTHFLEAKYETVLNLEDCFTFKSKSKSIAKGVILEFWLDNSYCYIYSDSLLNDFKGFELWEEIQSVNNKGIYIRTIYWVMIGYQQKTVLYDPNWIIDMGPRFKKFWEEVNFLRENPKKLAEKIKVHEGAKTHRREIKHNMLQTGLCLI